MRIRYGVGTIDSSKLIHNQVAQSVVEAGTVDALSTVSEFLTYTVSGENRMKFDIVFSELGVVIRGAHHYVKYGNHLL